MEKADIRSAYLLGGFLVVAYTIPFAVGIYTDNVIFDLQWLADLIMAGMNICGHRANGMGPPWSSDERARTRAG